MFTRLFVILGLISTSLVAGTAVRKCSGNKNFPLEVRVLNCDIPPCDIIKGQDMEFEIDFVVFNYTSEMKTLVRATTMGITVPYELPDDVSDACSNLKYGAYCPLYPEEDVTYKFLFPISNIYPEISVKIEISIVDQKKRIVTCFVCDIKVKKGSINPKLLTNLKVNKLTRI
ncbi:NPC intracellular cholesterol transporter 2-like [Eupeodes corollae]|uniref:NPC intracellular cholesterol transporter 2-like n=1 Tax=Eupeodes corollae TaxID=290404 RepID=UPI00248FE367|nr:NPC intracellular cholesterol transporter 2-like [Eupeodes corollae]